MSPYFLLRLILIRKHSAKISLLDKFLLIIIGEIYIFGKNKIELRDIYEDQRRNVSLGITKKKLLFFIPGQWYSLSTLESAVLILMMPKKIGKVEAIFLVPYFLYLLLFDESRDKIKANHSIASALSLSLLFENIFTISRYYYFTAIKILRLNSNFFFYDEGSTNYHIFTTFLFKNYFFKKEYIPTWFRGYDQISIKLIHSSDFFYFGDDDKSKWLYEYRSKNKTLENFSITNIISDFNFKKSILDKYFKVLKRDNAILLVCIKGSSWGHAHYMVGSVLYFIDNKNLIKFKKNSMYTFNQKNRKIDRLFCCNSPIQKKKVDELKLAFFRPIPDEFTSIILYTISDFKLSISGNGWYRHIDYSCDVLKIVDTSTNNDTILSSFLNFHNININYTCDNKIN
jgi:hypothetical protein